MATVRLRQTTDMSALAQMPPSWTVQSGYELDVGNGAGGVSITALGSFTGILPLPIQGTITECLIDTDDLGMFPNLDITDLNYVTPMNFFSITHATDLHTLVASLLAESDSITGSAGNDTILGFDGDDTLIGGSGADVLNGGSGNDTASYRTASTGLFAGIEDAQYNSGEAAGDTYISIENLEGSQYGDFLYGDGLANRLSGLGGNDVFAGKAGADTFDGGAGSDTVSYDASPAVRADLLTPATNTGDAAGDVYLSIENLDGSSFDDILCGDNAANVIRGSSYPNLTSGNDALYGRGGNDTLFGFDGNDVLNGGLGADKMAGGTGNDIYYVDSAGDTVTENPAEGTDTIYTSTNYTIGTGAPIEVLRANAGTIGLVLTGNAFANTIVGNTGSDTLSGDAGNDVLNGGAGADVMAGGTGNDIYYVDHAGDVTNEAAGAGTDTIRTTLLSKTLSANLENLAFIGSGNFAGTGNTLNNAITGGAGNDTLSGGAGNDGLTGGTGLDSFLFNQPLNALTNIDNILDFSVVDDAVLLSHLVFTALGPVGALPAGEFFTGSSAGDAGDRIIYNGSTGALRYDFDGTGIAASVQFAHLTGGLALTNSDFRVV